MPTTSTKSPACSRAAWHPKKFKRSSRAVRDRSTIPVKSRLRAHQRARCRPVVPTELYPRAKALLGDASLTSRTTLRSVGVHQSMYAGADAQNADQLLTSSVVFEVPR